MGFYTLFKGWLLLSPPLGFLVFLVLTRPQLFRGTFPLVLKYVISKN